jgi:hypothetical protein
MFDRPNLNSFAIASLVAMALAVVIVMAQVPAVMRAVLASSGDSEQVSTQLASYLEAHEQNMNSYVARFNGRSIFDTPRPSPVVVDRPVVTVVEQPPAPPEDTGPTGPPPPPARYGGPSLLAIFGTEVWFKPQSAGSPPMRIATGQELDGITVLEVFPPQQMARLGWQRGEYDVYLWDNWGDAVDPLFPEAEPVATAISAPGFQLETPEEESTDEPAVEDDASTEVETVAEATGESSDASTGDDAATTDEQPVAGRSEPPEK